MSLIATFHLLKKTNIDLLFLAAKTELRIIEKKGLIFKKKITETIDNYPEFLKINCTELEIFQYSGNAFNGLDLFLDTKGINYFTSGLQNESDKISELRSTSACIYDHVKASALILSLKEINILEKELSEFIEEEYGVSDSEALDAILASLKILKKWLSSIKEDEFGLLEIG